TVFDTLVQSAAKLCDADLAGLNRAAGAIRPLAFWGYAPEEVTYMKDRPIPLGRGSTAGRAIVEGRTVHIHDVLDDAEYQLKEEARAAGVRTTLAVPLMRTGTPIGVFVLQRRSLRPFTKKQIELAETFADQAVIAIENVRLFDEVQARTRQLAQSVDELRALGDVSQAVNSTLDLTTVLSTIVSRAVQLSGTEAGAMYEFDEQQRELHLRSTYGMNEELITALRDQHIGLGEPTVHRAVIGREPVQIEDLTVRPPPPP